MCNAVNEHPRSGRLFIHRTAVDEERVPQLPNRARLKRMKIHQPMEIRERIIQVLGRDRRYPRPQIREGVRQCVI